jgi:alpha-beta hydrolase superfamily lysophospholipase
MFIESFDGTKLFLNKETRENDRAVCVIVHGLKEHQGHYDYLAEKFHEAGIGTCRFDHRGHGRSEGERAYYRDFKELSGDVNAVADLAVKENPDRPVFILGHSMGGFASLLFGAGYPGKRIRGIIVNGALSRDTKGSMKHLKEGIDPHFRISNPIGAKVCSVPEILSAYEKDPLNLSFYSAGLAYALKNGVAWLKEHIAEFRYPVLMTHGEKDMHVSVQDTYETFALLPSEDKQMKIYGGMLHEIYNEAGRDETIGDAAAWILNRS